MTIGLIIGSTRKNSNSRLLGEKLVAGTESHILETKDLDLVDYEDSRHEDAPASLDEHAKLLLEFLLENDVIVFAVPIYWYGIPGKLKGLLDRLSYVFRQPDFKHKKPIEAIVLAVGGDRPRFKGLPLIMQFQHMFDLLGIHFSHYILAEGNKPGDVMNDEKALAEVKWLHSYLKGEVQ
ncbi:Multimeric flavodoxin WrbA [Terribacillus aidingensis]|uniref:Multimeric flavodoxin WrbA n=1 Tax=Terribacillus aidingensis TaxID=586416 RepID=A0A285P8M9_9BACI|nr:flavodoxin family protein [Terribacillus aidingensis]SNZ16241.1 Multimeric flavodoxin WrbA [Terribacillus aidingensis]